MENVKVVEKSQYLYVPNIMRFLSPNDWKVFCCLYWVWSSNKFFNEKNTARATPEKVRDETSLSAHEVIWSMMALEGKGYVIFSKDDIDEFYVDMNNVQRDVRKTYSNSCPQEEKEKIKEKIAQTKKEKTLAMLQKKMKNSQS